MEYSIAHQDNMNSLGEQLHPDGRVPWRDAIPPNLTGQPDERTFGSLRGCAYCGSMHPHDVAEAIKAGAIGNWADRKYGYPHKAYFYNVPNPHAGLPESRASCNFKPDHHDWVQVGENHWREPGRPASAKTSGKFYTVHLVDATPEDRKVIERHLGLRFVFYPDGKLAWSKWTP